ncbi:MAG: acyltransferase family protein [Hyphomicrobiaceae bacterium]
MGEAVSGGTTIPAPPFRVRDRASYLAHVDGLRAVAISLVVIYHAWPRVLPGGFIGVDVFFVVSGFLITRLMLAEMQAGTFSLLTFLARRMRRLAPAAVVMMTAVLAVGWMLLLPETFRELGRSVVAASLMFANILFARTAGYFSAPPEEKPLLHTWSLSVEDQFYLTWPLLLMLLYRRLSRRWLVVMAAALLAASLAHAELTLSKHPNYAFYMLAPRAWELLAGCVLALVAGRIVLPRAVAEALGLAGLATIFASAILLSSGARFPGLAALPAVVGTLFVIMAGIAANNAPLTARALGWRPLVFVGLISYSLYLWHWPLLSFGQYAAGRPLTDAEAGLAVGMSVVIAIASWRYVERPFRHHGPLLAPQSWRTIASGGAAIAVLAVSGGAVRGLDGIPSRFDGAVGKLFGEMARGNPLRPPCDGYHLVDGTDAACNFGRRKSQQESYDLAVMGDSNADHLVPMMTVHAERLKLAARQVTQSACAPLLGVAVSGRKERQNRECRLYQEAIIRFVEANQHLKIVVLSAVWPSYAGGLVWNGLSAPGLVKPRHDNRPLHLKEALGATVAFFRSRGIRVHLFAQVPHFNVLPARCTVRAIEGGGDPASCGRKAEEAAGELAASEAVLKALAAADPGVTVTLPRDAMCGPDWCSPMKDGVFLYRDAGHLNAAGSRHLARYFAFPELH